MYTQKQLEVMASVLEERMQEANKNILIQMAKRIKRIGEITPSDARALQNMKNYGADMKKIDVILRKSAEQNILDMRAMYKKVAKDGYDFQAPFYTAKGLDRKPFTKNTELQKYLQSIIKTTDGTLANLSNTKAVMLLDSNNNIVAFEKAYKDIIDTAVLNASRGMNYQTEMAKVMRKVSNAGMRVGYESGITRRLDTAVRQNILDGSREINQNVQDITGKEFGADGKEISVHMFPAEDHAPYQGKQFTDKEYEQLQNKLERPIGKWNCHHFAFSIIVGISEPTYNQTELNKINADNKKGFEFEGKKYSMYEATQVQRQIETAMRYQSDDIEIAKAMGNEEMETTARTKYRLLAKKYARFSNQADLSYKLDKIGKLKYAKVK